MSIKSLFDLLDPSSSSPEASPVPTSRARDGAWDSSEESAVPYGWKCSGSSAWRDRLSSSLRTFLLSELAGSTPFFMAWRRRVTPRGRWWWVLGRSGLRSEETGSGSLEWPTITLCGNHNHKGASRSSGDGLTTAVLEWPTITAEPYGSNQGGGMGPDGQPKRASPEGCAREWSGPRASERENRGMNATPSQLAGKHGWNLAAEVADGRPVKEWPGPTARDWRSTGASAETHDRNSRPLSEVVGPDGRRGGERSSTPGSPPEPLPSLNASWVESLQGAPPGWTELPDEVARELYKTRSPENGRRATSGGVTGSA